MFDIVSSVREKIFRRPKLYTPLAGEEVSEKQTTKLGYSLLICMFGAIMTSAQWTLSIIAEIPNTPTEIPYCLLDILNAFDKNKVDDYSGVTYDYGDSQCSSALTSQNPKFDFSSDYSTLMEPYQEIQKYQEKIQQLNTELYNANNTQGDLQKNYDTSLVEKIAREESGLYDTVNIQEEIEISRSWEKSIQTEITENEKALDQLRSQYSTALDTLAGKIETAQTDYKKAYLLYRTYVALLSLLFAGSIFTLLYNLYSRQKGKNSPHTIIFSVATFAYGLILLQISSLFVWDIIPQKILEIIIRFFNDFEPLLYLAQFLWPILIVALFGYLVFRVQRNLYSPQNILKRFISDKKCPHCDNSVDYTKPFCPLCSHEIQIHCPACKQLSVKDMPYCANCGQTLK